MVQSIKKIAHISVALALAFALGVPTTFAQQESLVLENRAGKTVSTPKHAVEVAPNIFSLGSTFDAQHGKKVEGYMIVHPHKEKKRPSGTPGGGGGASACYGFLATGAKWKTLEPWVVNTTNSEGLADASVLGILSNSITKWEGAANFDILGSGAATSGILVADEISTDGRNEVYFGALDDNNTIGVTIVWGIFGGPQRNRQLVEWDQVYNTYYDWSDAGAATAMDFESIATHELGHSIGLADLYTSDCAEQTMYGYGSEGETKTRTLESGDIAGVNALY